MFSLPLINIVGDVIRRVLPPEKISEADRLKIETDISTKLSEMDWKKFKAESQDRDSARMLDQKGLEKGNALTTSLAALHRPIWSIGCFLIFSWTLVGPQFGLPIIELTEIHKGIMQSVIIFYFGGRSIEKVSGTLKK